MLIKTSTYQMKEHYTTVPRSMNKKTRPEASTHTPWLIRGVCVSVWGCVGGYQPVCQELHAVEVEDNVVGFLLRCVVLLVQNHYETNLHRIQEVSWKSEETHLENFRAG